MDEVAPQTAIADEVLLERVARGDEAALRALHDRHAPWLRLRLRRRCGDDDLVFEAIQDTFVAVWRHPDGWAGTGQVAAWLWGIASRRLIAAYRVRNHWPDVVEDGAEVAPDLVAGLDTEAIDALLSAVSGLAPDLQAAIRSTFLDGLSISETSVLLGIPAGTVKTRVMRAKAQLRGALR